MSILNRVNQIFTAFLPICHICFYSNSLFAQPAPPISRFDVLAVTSAVYNPVLPNPLTPSTVLNMNWDVVSGPSAYKQSNYPHSGSWTAFVTEMYGFTSGGSLPFVSYGNSTVMYFGQVNLVNAGLVYGFYHEFYCENCGAKKSFITQAVSLNGSVWTANMYVN